MASHSAQSLGGDPRSAGSIHLFNNASNIQFEGGTNTFIAGGVINNISLVSARYGIPTLELLLSHCALDAFVDSMARHNSPRCSSATHAFIQHQIIEWINGQQHFGLVLWLSGPPASGKSALAQTIAEHFDAKKGLIGSFFFSCTGSSPSCANGNCLVPTLVYQLMQIFPETRAYIERKIADDPAIFSRNRRMQMQSLFCEPLQQFSLKRSFKQLLGKQARLIVIDGLNECSDASIQSDILYIIAEVVTKRTIPLKFLITSRPEPHIEQAFVRYFPDPIVSQIKLEPETARQPEIVAGTSQVQADPSLIYPFTVSGSTPSSRHSSRNIPARLLQGALQLTNHWQWGILGL